MIMLFGGCNGRIVSVFVDNSVPRICDGQPPYRSDEPSGVHCGVPNNIPVYINVYGRGQCDKVGVDFGDGTRIESYGPVDFGDDPNPPLPWTVSNTYLGSWPGPKTIRAYSVANCVGEATQPINVLVVDDNGQGSMNYSLAYVALQECGVVPHINKPLRQNTRVHISSINNPPLVINFGCFLGGCIYNADGEPYSIAPNSFPFPGYKKYSLIFRVGQQIIQGGTNMNFTTNQRGFLEVCANDDFLGDNDRGAWGIKILVDESQAP